ncbi:MAG: NAD-dependent deacylase [Sphaerotilus sp.]|jgi:NAD-dependent deacetylase|nr:NAD-dependent deacylase [Sphaerotilus sp.]
MRDRRYAHPFRDLRAKLRQAASVCVLSGAGMSAESGIPTFRDAQTGLWANLDPMQLASEAGFRADPQRVWDWYQMRRDGVRQAEPNAGHVALARYAARHPGRLTILTQNVDDLHQRAAAQAGEGARIVALHGSILTDRWLDACPRGEDLMRRPCEPSRAEPGRPPRCPDCGNRLRPGVVWFGESLDYRDLTAAEEAASACDVMLVVGTSGAVWPAAGLAARARHAGAHVVILNTQVSEIDDEAHIVLTGSAATLLPRLLDPL